MPSVCASGSVHFTLAFRFRLTRRCCIVAVCLAGWCAAAGLHAAEAAPAQDAGRLPGEPPVPARVFQVGVLTDNHPFSFVDEAGMPRGFAYELLEAVEQTMGLRLSRTLGPTNVINSAFRDGRIEVLQSYAQSPEREAHADFSVPYLEMAGAIFVREGEGAAIRSFRDLVGRRVMVHRGSLGEQLLQGAGLGETVVHVDSVEDSLRRLQAGEADAVLASRLTALLTIHRLDLDHLVPLDVVVPGYTVRYCFAVPKGEATLLAQLNEGLAIVQRTERFEELYRKWFGQVDPRGFTALQLAFSVAGALAVACGVAMWAALRQGQLRRRLARKAEELRASETRYRGVFESALDGILVLARPGGPDAPLIVEDANPALRRLLRLPADWVAGGPLATLPGAPALAEPVAEALASAQPSTFEALLELEGQAITVQGRAAGRDGRLLLVLADRTEEQRAHARLRQSELQLRQAQKLEAIGTLASGIAHDFNNLLTCMRGYAELAQLELDATHPAHGFVDEVLRASARARDLVRQILTFSRRGDVQRQPVVVGALIEETVRFLRGALRSNVQVRHEIAPDLPTLAADASQLQQVLMNLGTNAAHALGEHGGVIEIKAQLASVQADDAGAPAGLRPGPHLQISVRDDGNGMPPEVLQRIFEPFFTTKGAGEGTGLGLAVVHGIVQGHGGAITVYSQPGTGTVFHLFLPIARSEMRPAEDPADVPLPSGRGENILVLDDEEAIGRIAADLLTRLGYRARAFRDPVEALAEFFAASGDYDLVLTDLTMPQFSGLEVVSRMRALRPGLPVVLASGFLGERERAHARALNITRLIDKPLTRAELARVVHEALREARRATLC